jgi:hypothetical protein
VVKGGEEQRPSESMNGSWQQLWGGCPGWLLAAAGAERSK